LASFDELEKTEGFKLKLFGVNVDVDTSGRTAPRPEACKNTNNSNLYDRTIKIMKNKIKMFHLQST